jgi:hypothetical protein
VDHRPSRRRRTARKLPVIKEFLPDVDNENESPDVTAFIILLSGFEMSAEKRNTHMPPKSIKEKQYLQWASMFTGNPALRHGTFEHAMEQLVEWWCHQAERISRQIPELPEDFRTIRIWRQIKFVENYMLRLKPVFSGLQTQTLNPAEAMDHLRHIFSEEEARLAKWKQSLDNLQGLILWLPAFSHAREYLLAAFPLGTEYPDSLAQSLIRSIRDPYPFLDARTRERFDGTFLEFKKNYIENYSTLHEALRNTVRDVKKEESKVDPVALRNLDLLSGLQYTDKSYLNRVNVLAHWIKQNQCTLPVSRILERYPRCYCNFNPCSIRQPAGPVGQINAIVQEGIQTFRTALSRCRTMIQKEAKALELDEGVLAQIEAIMGNETLPPLKEQSIDSLNRIIRRHPAFFHSKIREREVLDQPQT